MGLIKWLFDDTEVRKAQEEQLEKDAKTGGGLAIICLILAGLCLLWMLENMQI